MYSIFYFGIVCTAGLHLIFYDAFLCGTTVTKSVHKAWEGYDCHNPPFSCQCHRNAKLKSVTETCAGGGERAWHALSQHTTVEIERSTKKAPVTMASSPADLRLEGAGNASQTQVYADSTDEWSDLVLCGNTQGAVISAGDELIIQGATCK